MSSPASKRIDGRHILGIVFGKWLRSPLVYFLPFAVDVASRVSSWVNSITLLLLGSVHRIVTDPLEVCYMLTLCLGESSILKPGGWLQLIEIYHMIQSDNGTITDDNILRQMSTSFFSAIEDTKDPRAPLRFDSMMREAGLVELGSRMIPLPLNGWPVG